MTNSIWYRTVLVVLLIHFSAVVSAKADDEVRECLTKAIERLESQDYYWEAETETSVRGRPAVRRLQGWRRQDGLTRVQATVFNQPAEAILLGEKGILRIGADPWTTISLKDASYRSTGPSATMIRNIRRPHDELRSLLESSVDLNATESMVHMTTRREGAAAEATIKFEGGELTGYLVEVVVETGREQSFPARKEKSSISIKREPIPWDTVISQEALRQLNESKPESSQRLSPDQERQVFLRYGKRAIGVHDPSSIVQCGDRYWMFSTGTGILSWWSHDLQTWHSGPPVLPQMPDWVKSTVADHRGHFWAPDVIQIGDRYLLYYSVSSFGVNTSAIALASTRSLNPDDADFSWEDHGIVVQSRQGDDFNAIDPALIRTDSGELWMSFGSFWSGLKLLQLDPDSGIRISENSALHSLAWSPEIEAPHITSRDGWFYLFVNHGKCCRGVESTYTIRVGRSRSITGPYLDRDGRDLLHGGGTLVIGTDGPFIGPGHANVSKHENRFLLHVHFYDGTENGRSMLAITELHWDTAGWPTVSSEESSEK